MANSEKISLKLIVDKKNNRVVFAESDKDFVDILFSFLTLPVGTIIRLLRHKSPPLGCFSRLYESIENLDTNCLETPACKNTLLQPRSAAEMYCYNMKINLNDLPQVIYKCPDPECTKDFHWLYSSVAGARCSCGKTMDVAQEWTKNISKADNKDGVFVYGGARRFIVTDDLEVMAASTLNNLALLNKLGIRDGTILVERDVEIGHEEVLSLLERSLVSKTPISEVFLGPKLVKVQKLKEYIWKEMQTKLLFNKHSNQVDLKLVLNKDNGDVLYAEAKDDFINLLFGFLTFPLGFIVDLLDSRSNLGCVDKLFNSVQTLNQRNPDILKGWEYWHLLIFPKLALHFGCSDQVLKIEELEPPPGIALPSLVSGVNPKLPGPGTEETGGGFVKGPTTYLVARDLAVMSMSPATAINLINRAKVPFTSLEEKMVKIGEAEALKILIASLFSCNALNNALSSRKRKKRKSSA